MSLFDSFSSFEYPLEAFLTAVPSTTSINDMLVPVKCSRLKTTTSALSSAFDQTTLFLSLLDSAIDKLTAFRRLHDRPCAIIHNAMHDPLLVLPTDIIGSIFEHAVAEARQRHSSEYYQEVFNLGQVCSEWRAVAFSCPRLFTYFNFEHLGENRQSDMWLEKSGQCALDIAMGDEQHNDLITSLAPRIRSLRYCVLPGQRSFERLDVLEMAEDDDPVDHFDWNVPALRQLKLFHPLKLPISVTSHLRILSLRDVYTYNGLRKVLMSAEQLEGLELFDGRCVGPPSNANGKVEEDPVKVVLKALQHLRIVRYESMGHFFNQWTCPNLTTFYWDEAPLWDFSVDQFLQRSPYVHTLVFDIGDVYYSSASIRLLKMAVTSSSRFLKFQTLRLLGTPAHSGHLHYQFIKPFLETLDMQPQPNASSSSSPAKHPSQANCDSVPPAASLLPLSSSSSPVKIPIRLEIEDWGLLEEYDEWYEERVETVVQIIDPDPYMYPHWYLGLSSRERNIEQSDCLLAEGLS